MAIKPKLINIAPEMVEAAKRGDQFAISEIYRSCYNTIYYVVKSIIVEEDTTQDVVQDSFMKAFRNLSRLENSAAFVPWMKRVATNTAKDWLKRKKPILFSSMYPDDGEVDQEPEFEDVDLTRQPEEALDAKTKKQLLWDIINDLSEEQRLVVSMFYFQEMSVADIASDLGVSQGTVKSRLNYARKKIEYKVLDLEKKGTKLYGLAPVPFLIWLFLQNQQANPVGISAVAGSGARAAASASAKARTAASAKARTAASAKARTAASARTRTAASARTRTAASARTRTAASARTRTAAAARAKMAAAAKTGASAAGKGLAVKVTAGVMGVAAAGGIVYGAVRVIATPRLYSWYMEPSVSATDINILLQEVPDTINSGTSNVENWQRAYSGDACYIIADDGVGLVNYEGETIVPPTYDTVALEEFGTIVLTDDTGSYTVTEDGQITPYVKPESQATYEENIIEQFEIGNDDMPVGLYLFDPYEDGPLYYDAGVKSDGVHAVEDDNGLWGYVDATTGETVVPIFLNPAWNIDTDFVDIDFINHFRNTLNPVFEVNMEDPENYSGKGSFQTSRAYDASDGYLVVNYPNQGYSLITTSGKTVIPAGKFYQLRPVHDGKLWAQKQKNGEWGILQLDENAISRTLGQSQ